MSENKSLGISYGVFAPPIPEQIKTQGFKFDNDKAIYFEKLRESINHLRLSNLLTETSASKMIAKLHKQVVAHVNRKNKLETVKP